MIDTSAALLSLGGIVAAGTLTGVVSLARRDVSIVDSLWSLMFLLAAVIYLVTAPERSAGAWLIVALVALWALRLAAYITWRNWGEGEDRRYQAIRARNQPHFAVKSLLIVFALQGVLAWIISLPLLVAIHAGPPLGALALLAAGVWLLGMGFEAGGDWQLARFKADPANRGKVLDRGLWRYTRHPNYFGNALIWWAFFLFALAAGGWWTVVSPLLMTFLLLKVSGVALLEQDISERRPEYQSYVRRTNAFLPGPPRARSGSGQHTEVNA
jgi:steroid 5-alpha reductase family enzyme